MGSLAGSAATLAIIIWPATAFARGGGDDGFAIIGAIVAIGAVIIVLAAAALGREQQERERQAKLEQLRRDLAEAQEQLAQAQKEQTRLQLEAEERLSHAVSTLVNMHLEILKSKFLQCLSKDDYGNVAIGKKWVTDIRYFTRTVILNDPIVLEGVSETFLIQYPSEKRAENRRIEARIETAITTALFEYCSTDTKKSVLNNAPLVSFNG